METMVNETIRANPRIERSMKKEIPLIAGWLAAALGNSVCINVDDELPEPLLCFVISDPHGI
jgi:hypothetical protein